MPNSATAPVFGVYFSLNMPSIAMQLDKRTLRAASLAANPTGTVRYPTRPTWVPVQRKHVWWSITIV